MSPRDLPDFRCGILTDIQYADVDDAPNASGNQWRHYRGTLDVACRAVELFNTEHEQVGVFHAVSQPPPPGQPFFVSASSQPGWDKHQNHGAAAVSKTLI